MNQQKQRAAISRFTIILIGAVLTGMGLGRELTGELSYLCSMAGLFSVACYLALELVHWNGEARRAIALQHAAEVRLSQQKQQQRLARFCLREPSKPFRTADRRLNAATCSL
jgi:hypothetical protein